MFIKAAADFSESVGSSFNQGTGAFFQMFGVIEWRFSYGFCRFFLITSPTGIGVENHFDLVSNPAKHRQFLLVGTRRMGRIREAPMVAIQLTRE